MSELLTTNDGIIRSKERTNSTGEVFTPDSICQQMIDYVSQEIISDPTKTFCDPTCGNGQILCNILLRRLAAGVSKKDAISTLYGVELMEDNTLLCRKRLAEILGTDEFNDIIKHNIVCHNFFDWDFEHWRPKKKNKTNGVF